MDPEQQECETGSGIRNLFDPGSGMEKNSDPMKVFYSFLSVNMAKLLLIGTVHNVDFHVAKESSFNRERGADKGHSGYRLVLWILKYFFWFRFILCRSFRIRILHQINCKNFKLAIYRLLPRRTDLVQDQDPDLDQKWPPTFRNRPDPDPQHY